MEGNTVTMEQVRTALQSFGADGQEITNAQLYAALEQTCEAEKARTRRRIADMISHGEVVRAREGVYTYNFAHRPREGRTYTMLWRFIRKAKPGWSINECAQMTRVSYTQAQRYVAWLENENYVMRDGKNERRAVTYRSTAKAAQSPETPYPPIRETDPFERERVAAATITRLMLCADPYNRKTAQTIAKACRVLLERFENPVTQFENGGEVQ